MPYGSPPAILTESAPAVKISLMTAAVALTGAELVPLVQAGANVQSTAAAIAGLASVAAILVESGAAAKISALPAAAALAGTEQVPINQGGTTVRTTTLAIAALAVPATPVNSLQYNNAGVFGGSANATFDGVNLTTLHTATVSTGNLTVTPGTITTGNTTALSLKTSGGTQFQASHTASAVNFLRATGGAAGNGPALIADGSDTNISPVYYTKGTGDHTLVSSFSGLQQLKVGANAAQASIADIFRLSGGNGNAFIQVEGATANINAQHIVKGTGELKVWKNTPLSGQPIFRVSSLAGTPANFIALVPQGTGGAASIQVDGSDTDRSLQLNSTGVSSSFVEIGRTTLNFALMRVNTFSAGNTRLDVSNVSNDIELKVSLTGGLTNQNLILKPAGTGNVVVDPGTGTTLTIATATATTLNLYNTVVTTANVLGAATTITLGATTGTLTLRNATIAHPNAAAFTVGADPGGGNLVRIGGALTVNSATMIATKTAFTNGAAAQVGTLTNAPAAGDPTKWIPVDDNGTTRYIPAW